MLLPTVEHGAVRAHSTAHSKEVASASMPTVFVTAREEEGSRIDDQVTDAIGEIRRYDGAGRRADDSAEKPPHGPNRPLPNTSKPASKRPKGLPDQGPHARPPTRDRPHRLTFRPTEVVSESTNCSRVTIRS